MRSIIGKSIKDILSIDVILFMLKIGFMAFVIISALLWAVWESMSAGITSYLSWISIEWIESIGAGVVNFILAYIMFIVTISILTSLYSEKLLKKLAKKHYPNVAMEGKPNTTTSIMLTLKAVFIFLILLMPAIPIFFVPIVGQIVMLYLMSTLINKPTQYDINALFSIPREKNIKRATSLAMLASLFNYVPILNLFTAIFAQILFLHSALSSKR